MAGCRGLLRGRHEGLTVEQGQRWLQGMITFIGPGRCPPGSAPWEARIYRSPLLSRGAYVLATLNRSFLSTSREAEAQRAPGYTCLL